MQSQTWSIQFGGKTGKRLIRFLVFISLIGGVIMVVKVMVGALIVAGIFAGVLFTAAGRMDWMEAWILVGLYAVSLLGMMLWGAIHAPDLMRERSAMAKNVKKWDKVINRIFTLMFIVTLVVAGLDAGRFGWSTMPAFIKWLGGLGCAIAGYVVWLTIKENAYLSRWARIQNDRGHRVVSSGPYRIVRHPMYAAIILFILCIPFELGSWLAVIPASLAMILYVTRTKKEDRMLHEELDGYDEYASQVRYRLMPGVW
jgi:protein-S-isoprenylcysteine O-methyltransferase Ste14